MLIYNVTTKLHHAIHQAWLSWMKETHIPEVLATGCFEKFQLARILETDEEEGPTYAVQYYAASDVQYKIYIQQYAPALRQAGIDKWGGNMSAFRPVMEVVH